MGLLDHMATLFLVYWGISVLFRASLMAQTVKRLPRNVGDLGSVPGSGRSPGEGNGNPLQCSCLENPTDRGAWRSTVHGVAKSQTLLSDFPFTFHTVFHSGQNKWNINQWQGVNLKQNIKEQVCKRRFQLLHYRHPQCLLRSWESRLLSTVQCGRLTLCLVSPGFCPPWPLCFCCS